MKALKLIILLFVVLLSACSAETETGPAGGQNETIVQENPEPAAETEPSDKSAAPAEQAKPETSKPAAPAASLGSLKVQFIDIGQGDSIYVHTPQGDDIIIDGGNKSKGDEVVSFLRQNGVKDIEVLISTHPDADHIGGLDEVLEAFPVKSIFAPRVSHSTQAFEDFLLAVQQEGVKIQSAKAGVVLPLIDKNVKADFLAPVREYPKSDLNDWSAVLHIQFGKTSFMFTGDAELKSEEDMLGNNLPEADVLKVSHHGAEEATSEQFLRQTRPKVAVISAGAGNGYGHPRQPTLDRLKSAGAKVYRTDLQGTITVMSDGSQVEIQTER